MGKAIVQIKGGKVGICKSMKGLKMERRRKGERGFFLKKKRWSIAYGHMVESLYSRV